MNFERIEEFTEITQLMGMIEDISFGKLISIFGVPQAGDQRKTFKEWHLRFEDGTVANIYDWNIGLEGYRTNLIWNIGGTTPNAVKLVREAINGRI